MCNAEFGSFCISCVDMQLADAVYLYVYTCYKVRIVIVRMTNVGEHITSLITIVIPYTCYMTPHSCYNNKIILQVQIQPHPTSYKPAERNGGTQKPLRFDRFQRKTKSLEVLHV